MENNMDRFPEKSARFALSGAVGELELMTSSPRKNARAITAVICHPHPLQEGTMDNKVVHTLSKVFDTLGCRTVRFNFRGVGKSEGSFGEGIGELEDLKAVVGWVKSVRPDDELCLAGFSFGGYVSLKGSAFWPIKQLISIAPPAGHPYYKDIPEISCPWILVQGDDDEVTLPHDQVAWVETLENKPSFIEMQGAGHFFHGKLIELREVLLKELSDSF
jgi:alpha/beta superfamily hydrolase